METGVTELGTLLAITYLPKLAIIKCRSSLKVVASLKSQIEHHVLPLTTLHCAPTKNLSYVKGALETAVQFCPFVVHVDLFNIPGVFDQELKALLNLQQLQRLSLEDIAVSFDRGILPILQKFGSKSLQKLKLISVTEVDVAALIKACPKLRSLKLMDINRYIPPPQPLKVVHQLLNLAHLKFEHDLHPSEGSPSPADIFLLLLSSPSLVTLKINFLNRLTDRLIERVVRFHGFAKLKVLELEMCNKVTKASIDLLLSSSSPITSIDLVYCRKLTQESCGKDWKKMAMEKNLDLTIDILS